MKYKSRVSTRTVTLVALLAIAAIPSGAAAAGQGDRLEIPDGSSHFRFFDETRPGFGPITVWVHRPAQVRPSSPIVFVIHGMDRDARRYRDQWRDHADLGGFLVVSPEFDEASYPSRAFQRGNVVDSSGSPLPRNQWTYAVIESVFDVVREASRLRTSTYSLYGHSAGGQFVHRFVLFMRDSRCSRAVAANAGWYTMPTLVNSYPYGLETSPANEQSLRQALQMNLVVMVGEQDTDSADPTLHNTARAKAQGRNRVERSRSFYEAARSMASRLGVPLRWRHVVVPGVGHSNRLMSGHAVQYLVR